MTNNKEKPPALPMELEGLQEAIERLEGKRESSLTSEYGLRFERERDIRLTVEAARRYAQSPARVNREAIEALNAVKKEQIQSDMNDLENKTYGTYHLETKVQLTLETRKLCEKALASAEQLERSKP